jgi:exopolyphosphatase/guanosine-5'-triphosphate,3'-diphosphate pyrophosphatase
VNPARADQVRVLLHTAGWCGARQLFDAIGPRVGLSATDRQILSDAALLHDVGYHINYENHHKHSYHLIVHADMLGMSPEEQVAIANVARYHRGAPPKRKHENYGILDRGLRRRIRKLAGILRVADGFDRGHIGAVERVKVRWLDRALRLTAVANRRAQSLRLDLWGASRKSALLAKVARIPVEDVAPDGTVVSPQDADDEQPD